MASSVLGVAYALWVPQGLPYDEPCHWSTVQYYAMHWSLPTLGTPGVTYSAEHPPLAYLFGAVVQRATGAVGSDGRGQVLAVRLVFGLLLVASTVVLERILRRAESSPTARVLGCALFALAPINLAIFWSVQNDGLLVFVVLSVTLVASRWAATDGLVLATRHLFGLGALLGVALLVKITAVWAVASVAAWLVWRERRAVVLTARGDADGEVRAGSKVGLGASVTRLCMLGVAVVAVSGWWFVRNLVTYGKLTASPIDVGLRAPIGAGVSAGTLARMARNAMTYLWVPTEYFRNLVALPTWADLIVIGVTLVLVVELVRFASNELRARRRGAGSGDEGPRRWALGLVGLVGGASLVGWGVLFVFVESFPARIGIVGLVLLAGVGGAAGAARLPQRLRRPAVATCVVLLSAASIWAVGSAHAHTDFANRLMDPSAANSAELLVNACT